MSREKNSLNNLSVGLGQADVTQPGTFKSTGVHISQTDPVFSCSQGILGLIFAADMVFFRERETSSVLTLQNSVAALLIYHVHTRKLKGQ